ncbi:acetyltransferase [Sinomicrobium sp. M5D2P9]
MDKRLINIFGAGGHARVIIEIAECNIDTGIGFVFDETEIEERILGKYPVILPDEIKLAKYPVIIAIGNNKVRKLISQRLHGIAPVLRYPTAVLSTSATFGNGTVVMANAVINAEACIGEHCIINTSAVIEHNCNLDDFVHISPAAALAGGVTIGEGTHVGTGASVIPGVKIGKWCTIGAGTVVIKDIPDGVTVVGNPGRIIGN